jgi:hypothetical protein
MGGNMKDQDKSKGQLVDELVLLRRRFAKLEKSEIKHKETKEALKESKERYEAIFERSLCCVCAMILKADSWMRTRLL